MTEQAHPTIAIVQMTSGIDVDANLRIIDAAMAAAAAQGAVMIFLPEMAVLLDRDRQRSAKSISSEADSSALRQLCGLAERYRVWLHTGSMPLLTDQGDKRVNRSHVISSDGSIKARYDKIHLFDVDLASGETWRESNSYSGGDTLAIIDTPIGKLGLTICYDVRFGEMYRALADRGADVIAVPAAFTVPTGEAHWHVLLRTRAIETACHIVAPAQSGDHADGRATFGHSLAIDPWGRVLADAGANNTQGFTLALAMIDNGERTRARAAIPLIHSRAIRRIAL